MRIEHAELTFLNLPMVQPELWAWGRRDSYTVGLVELHMDNGVVGIGEVIVAMGPNANVIRAIFEQMTEQFVGESPTASEKLSAKVMSTGWYSFHRTAGLVLGGLEMACWDAVGKHLDQPVCALMGGPLRLSFPSMYFVQGDDDLGVMIDGARNAVQRGFKTVYYKVGVDEERDVELVHRTREAIGTGPKLRVDANEAWSPGTAVRILRRMAPAVIEYIEQPTLMHDIDALAEVRARSGVAVAANQASWGKYAVVDVIRRGAADVIMTDLHQEGGLMAMKKVLGLCEMAGLPFVNHAYNATTLTITAHMHAMSSSSACMLAMQGHPDYFADDYVREPLDYSGGTIKFTERPGFGVEIDPDKLMRYRAVYDAEGMSTAYAASRGGQVLSVPSQ
jgi:L-alanine-DL-glutamate epimerase-like enolase superfamily enzyme